MKKNSITQKFNLYLLCLGMLTFFLAYPTQQTLTNVSSADDACPVGSEFQYPAVPPGASTGIVSCGQSGSAIKHHPWS